MGERVLIVDDDEIAGGLSRDLLNESGFEAELLTVSREAIAAIKEKGYKLVILDILMPGIDGLTLCRKIKTDPELSSVKVVIVSGKTFKAEKERARQYGCDLFIEKPYNVDAFVRQVSEVSSRPAAPPAQPAEIESAKLVPASEAALQVTVWGCRSLSGPTPREVSRYGRRTSCVSVEAGNRLFIFDAGSGIAALGEELVKSGRRKEMWIFLTHFHPDHVEGLGTFACAHSPECTLHISGANEPDKSLQTLVQEAFESSMGTNSIEANIDLYEMLEESYEVLPGVLLSSFYANHPGTTLGFALETQGRKLVYCPDSELYGEAATALQDYDEKLSRLCKGADLLIHDGRYTVEDYLTLRNNGHSSFASVVDFAGLNAVKRLLLFHHDNQYSDADLNRIGGEAARMIAGRGYSLQCELAREGLKIGI